MKRFYFYLMPLLLMSCVFDDEDESQRQVRYGGYMPNYSVNLPEDALESKLQRGVFQRGSSAARINYLSADENEIHIDCTDELNLANMAPRFPATSGSNAPICTSDNSLCITSPLGFLIYAYANGLFYDCNVRQQVRQDGLSRLCKLRSGSSGNIASGDLCDENTPSSQKMLAFSYISSGQSLEDYSRFVAWTMDPANPGTEDLEGMMINRYLQDDGLRSKTKVILNKVNGFKAVETLEFFYPDGQSTTDPNILTRIYVREAETGVNVANNYIVIRRWRESHGSVLAIRAHVRDGVGAIVYVASCPAATYADAVSSMCSAESSTPLQTTCFDTDHNAVNCGPFSGMASNTDSVFDHPDISINLDTFLDMRSISSIFDPGNYSPENL